MTGMPQLYRRRCNNLPREGITVTRATVESVLALALAAPGVTAVAVAGDLETGLSILIPAGRPWEVERFGTVARTFTYEPLPAGQRRAPAADA